MVKQLHINDVIIYGYDLKKNNYENKIISNNEVINIGNELITSMHTPGHYYDSLCFWNQDSKCVFTGDTIFVGRTGRVISERSSISELYNSIYNILLKLPEETMIYPGHHYGHKKSISFNSYEINFFLDSFLLSHDNSILSSSK